MKKLLGILIAILMSTISQASTITTNGDRYTETNLYETQPKTATPNAQVRVKHKKIIKTKVQRYIPFSADDSEEVFVQEEDLATGYRRRDLNKIEHEDGISERVRWRLFLARQLALLKHREIHS